MNPVVCVGNQFSLFLSQSNFVVSIAAIILITNRFGAKALIVPRLDLCDLFFRHVPKEHMHMDKKVVFSEKTEGIRLSFADGKSQREIS